MELATGPLPPPPSRPPAAPSAENRGDAWGDFLRRFLVVSPAKEARAAAAEVEPDAARLRSPATPSFGAALTAE